MFKTLKNFMGSIGVKFAAALIAMGAMTAISGAISYFSFQEISAQFKVLINERVVELEHSSHISDAADNLKGGLTEVLLAKNSGELTVRMEDVALFITQAHQEIEDLSPNLSVKFTPLLENVINGLESLAAARTEEFDQYELIQNSLAALSDLGDQANSTLSFQADDALYELKVGSGNTISKIDKALTKLVETDFKTLQLLLQVRVESNLLTGVLIAYSETRDPGLQPILQDLGKGGVERMTIALAELKSLGIDGATIAPLDEALAFFGKSLTGKLTGSTLLRRKTLSIRQSSDAVLSTAVDDIIFFLTIETESVSDENATAIRELMSNQVKKITIIANLQAAVEKIILLSLETVNIRDVADLAPLQNRLRAATIKLEKYSQKNNEILSEVVADIITIADPQTGITTMQRTFLDARTQSSQISRAAADSVTDIANLARNFAADVKATIKSASAQTSAGIAASQRSLQWVLLASVAIFLATISAIFLSVVRPLGLVSRSTEQLANGDMSALDMLKNRNGEIGRMTDALVVFRSNLIANKKMEDDEKQRTRDQHEEERKAEAARQEEENHKRHRIAEREREEREQTEAQHAEDEARRKVEAAENEERREEQARVVSALAHGLETLAAGDLTIRIEEKFPEAYDQLRADFNATVTTLEDVIRSISSSGDTIYSNSGEISDAADNLSRRTEDSASTLEETSSALGELTKAVQVAAQGAAKADKIVGNAKESAERSGEVVRETVTAMAQIEKSSREISKIINVIDDIAFQTNLLALNAGVEAARAGEAGRGFAVVATEVRSLAHRSSDAAKEISALISQSGAQVERGVSLVDETGEALQSIVAAVSEISAHVSEISRSADEQAGGISEINASIVQLDHVAQQNTAMFEETSAATHSLKDEASELSRLISKFRISGENLDPSLIKLGEKEGTFDETSADTSSFQRDHASHGTDLDEFRQSSNYGLAGE